MPLLELAAALFTLCALGAFVIEIWKDMQP